MSSYSSDPVKRKGRRSLLPTTWFRQKNHLNKRSTQTQSLFFSKLPPELRTQIYRWAYPYSYIVPIIHITRSLGEDKLVHFPCSATNPQDPSNWQADLGHDIEEWGVQHQICHKALLARLRHTSHDSPEGKPERTISLFLAIMLTCHLMFVLVGWVGIPSTDQIIGIKKWNMIYIHTSCLVYMAGDSLLTIDSCLLLAVMHSAH
jgi:2EXR family